jgi:bifunctional DNA-binding transcriptional regulator/antitoxin component of YhaV-PrlF toxin-antitoxin module
MKRSGRILMKVLFDTKKVQKAGRIALTDQLLKNAGLKEGDPVHIYFDATSKTIILERAEEAAEGASLTSTRSSNRTGKKA